MNVCLSRFDANGGRDSQMERAAARAQAAGVKWTRGGFPWAETEPERGKYDFALCDQEVDTALRHGLNIYGLMAYWSKWTTPYTDEGIDDFCRWARIVVNRYKDRVKVWEIYNEPNIAFWRGPKELYPVLLAKCYKAIKEADPSAQVLGMSLAGIDLGFLGLCMANRTPFDGLAFHPYRQKLVEDQFIDELHNVSERIGARSLWITEMGWSTNTAGVDERTQAQCLARAYLSAAASGTCRNISWYNFRNDGESPFENEFNFGVLRKDMTPKPAYRALATVCRTMTEGEPKLLKTLGEGVYALRMGNALAMWSSERDATVICRVAAGDLRMKNLMGEELHPDRAGVRLTLNLRSRCPVFLTGASVNPIKALVEKRDEKHVILF